MDINKKKKDINKKITSYNISLTAMMGVSTLIVLYLASILPYGNMTLYFITSVFAAALIVEDQPLMAVLMYIFVSLLGLLIVPSLAAVLPYVLLFGHYGLGKFFIERRVKDKPIAYVLKLLYFNVCMAGIFFLASSFIFTGFMAKLPLWALIVIIQVAFVIFDYIYSKTVRFYVERIRTKLVRK